jgi:hypothetical protein
VNQLTPPQKRHVCELAQKAYDAWSGRPEYERMLMTGKNGLTAWRHDQQETAIGVRSLRRCADTDYSKLLSHFHRLRMKHLAAVETPEFSTFIP